jgi:hypothetical protein
MLKLVSLHLDTQADTKLHVHVSQHGKRDCSNWKNGMNWTGSHQVSVAKYAVLSSFISSGKFLHDL